MNFDEVLIHSFDASLAHQTVRVASVMLKEHIGTTFNHFGPSSVTSGFPPRAARRPTVTPAGRFFELRPVISRQ